MKWDSVTEEKCQGQTDISGLLRILGFRFSVFSNFGQRFERNGKHHFRGDARARTRALMLMAVGCLAGRGTSLAHNKNRNFYFLFFIPSPKVYPFFTLYFFNGPPGQGIFFFTFTFAETFSMT